MIESCCCVSEVLFRSGACAFLTSDVFSLVWENKWIIRAGSYFSVPTHALNSVFSVAALQALKRKKRYEKQLAQIDGTLSTIEFQREALENANTSNEVLKNMGFAAKALKAAHKDL